MRERIKTATHNLFREFFPEDGYKTPLERKHAQNVNKRYGKCFRHVPTGVIYLNKKQCLQAMGQYRFARALANCEFQWEFMDIKDLPDYMQVAKYL